MSSILLSERDVVRDHRHAWFLDRWAAVGEHLRKELLGPASVALRPVVQIAPIGWDEHGWRLTLLLEQRSEGVGDTATGPPNPIRVSFIAITR